MRVRNVVKLDDWFAANNSPLYLFPQIVDEVRNYVFLSDDLAKAYRNQKRI